jgi:hypothetical protein
MSTPVVISASYRTDIPAFYAEWLLARLAAGFATVINPYSGEPQRVDLRPAAVAGIVFWTRNFSPLLRHLATLNGFGRPWVVQFTVTGAPSAIEPAVIPPEAAIEQIRRLAGEVHPLTPVWRYDPIVTTSLTPPDFHRANFERLATRLEGATDEVVVSFAQIYQKSRRNLDLAGQKGGFSWSDPDDEVKLALCADLTAIAAAHGMRLSVCSQPHYLAPGAATARCIDARRLEQIAGYRLQIPERGNRPGCACHASRDIGAYDSCPHGCAYCYAVRSRRLALEHYRAHRPDGESLIGG